MLLLRAFTPLVLIAVLIQPVRSAPASWPEVARRFEVQTLSPGVFAVVRQDPPGFAFESNSLVVVGEQGVLVVDAQSNLTTTRHVLAAIRAITPKPIRYLVNTHAHDDHTTGNTVYREAFPDLQIVAHREGLEDLTTGAVTRRRQFQAALPKTIAFFRGLLEKGVGFDGGPLSTGEREAFESDVALADGYATLPPGYVQVAPTLTFDERLALDLGDRPVQVLRLGRGHSMGDCVVFLPRERILAAGDLVVAPIPLVGTLSHPIDYATTMERLRDLGATIVVPGHGPVQRDDAHVKTIAGLLASLRDQVSAAVTRGDTLDTARTRVDLDPWRRTLAGDDRLRTQLFKQYVSDPGVARAYEQMRERRF